jgi:RHS repeat-associated protein
MGNITFYLYDHLGNTRVTYYQRSCGGTLTVENIIDYDPYGKVLREFSYNNDRERYVTTQHERDEETGYDYRGARFYDSDIARFLSVEPLAKKFHSWSSYNYVVGNPVLVIDPDGRDTLVIHMSQQLPELSKGNTGVYLITFSRIIQGVEIKTSIGGYENFYMMSNTDHDNRHDNDLQDKEYYKLIFDQMSGHPQWKNTIRVTWDGVFLHPGADEGDSGGCKFLCFEKPYENSRGNPAFYFSETIESLNMIRQMYDDISSTLTGDKFLLKSNSIINHPEKMKSIELSQTNLEDIFNKREDRGLINHRSADKK